MFPTLQPLHLLAPALVVSCLTAAPAFAVAVSADTNGGYGAQVMDIILANWTRPAGATGSTSVIVRITNDGRPFSCELRKSSGNPNVDDAKLLKLSKIITFVFAYLTLIPAVIMPSAALTNLFLTLQHVAAAPVSFAILVGLTWKRCTRQGAFWAMASGMVVGVAWMLLGLTDTLEAVYPTVLVSYTVGVVVSLATSKKTHGLAKE